MKMHSLLILVLFLLVAVPSGAADLQFAPTRSLTAGWPGDLPAGSRVAYNSRHKEYLVVYQYHNTILSGPDQIHAARLSADGSYIANYVVSDLPNSCRQPDVEYDPLNDRYLVVWTYDRNGDNNNWDIHGRFVPVTGPVDTLPSMKIGGFATWDEFRPRLAYGAVGHDFFVVCTLDFDTARQPAVAGFRVPADGSPAWHYTTIHEDTYQSRRMHPDIAYNPRRDEFMVVYGDGADIYAHIFSGHATYSQFYNVTDIGLPITELTPPNTPLPGIHDNPEIAFSRNADFYIIIWETDRYTNSGKIWARYYPDDAGSSPVYMERLDNSRDHDRECAVSCTTGRPGCLVTWIVNHNNTLYTFGREIILKSNAAGNLSSHDTGFFAPLDNLGAASSWSVYPTIGVAGGAKNYYLAFTGLGSNATYMLGRNSIFSDFPWPMFLPAIISGGK